MTPKFEWLEAFAEFGQDLNFTHAAARLHLSQPALHAQIRKLADALGVPLYERRGRRLVLTPAGVDTLRFARQMRATSESFVASVGGKTRRRRVVLAAGEGACLYLLGPAIRSFARRSPGGLRMLMRAADPSMEAVRRGEADLAVAALGEPPDDLDAEPLAAVRHALVVPRGHALAGRRRLSVAALADHPIIVPPPGSRLRATLTGALAVHGHELRVGVEASGWEPMMHFVKLGLGLAVVNGCCRLPRGLEAVPVSDLPEIRYHVLTAPDAPDDPEIARLRDALRTHAGDWRAGRVAAP